METLISVVIPLYNKERAILRTLKSVLKQTMKPDEIIVVDDGSTDDSLKVVQEFVCGLNKEERILKIVHKDNGGVSSARNRGIKEARGEYVALLDGDDLWEPTFIEEQMKLIQDFPRAAMWGVNTAFIKNGVTRKWEQGMGEGYRGYVENYFGTKHNDLFCSSSVVICKDVFEVVGFFDERIAYSEDLDMWYRIILRYPVVFYDKVLVLYNQDAENRCAYDLQQHYDLRKCLPYYVDKYYDEFERNKTFSIKFNNLCAVKILNEGYYFSKNVEDRKAADYVASKLIYSDIHVKYQWIFKTPRWMGYLVYKAVLIKKNIFK